MTRRETFDLVIQLGEVTLVNGGEIARTKITMERVAKTYGVRDFSSYVVADGIFITGVMGEGLSFCTKVKCVPLSPVYLCRVEAINNLSREIVAGSVTPEEAKRRLEEIKVMSPYSIYVKALSSGIGSAAFCFLVGGTYHDSLVVLFIGILLNILLFIIQRNTLVSKIMRNVLGSAFVTLLCCFARHIGFGTTLGSMIIGCIMPLVPGIPLTNAIRHFFDNDYLSGVIRLVDALLVALSISTGVGVVIMFWNSFIGGISL